MVIPDYSFAPTTGHGWIILTPDLDRYEEDLHISNLDFEDYEYLGANPAIPARIPARSVYGFGPLDPGVLARQMDLARQESNALKAQRGVALAAPAMAPEAAAPVAPPALG